jgi:hypothetical protein
MTYFLADSIVRLLKIFAFWRKNSSMFNPTVDGAMRLRALAATKGAKIGVNDAICSSNREFQKTSCEYRSTSAESRRIFLPIDVSYDVNFEMSVVHGNRSVFNRSESLARNVEQIWKGLILNSFIF